MGDIRAGDEVLHGPSGETWVVKRVNGDRLEWCGWPPGRARVEDCTLTQACSDAEHQAMNDYVDGMPGAVPRLVGELAQAEPEPLERAGREGDSQPLPTPNDRPAVQDMVIADIQARRELGVRRYGTSLQAFNGRDALRDAYEEALDLACYLRQVIEEREARG
jgi:hypothetical protein